MTVDEPQVCADILVDLLKMLSLEAIAPAFERESRLRLEYGPAQAVRPGKTGELKERAALLVQPGRDIYGQPSAADTRYFVCKRCDRSIAGQRFAAHVARCVTRSRR